jgi:di/tricarboxylate transporter
MAGQLNTLGLIKWFASTMGGAVAGWAWMPALIVLLLVYVYACTDFYL